MAKNVKPEDIAYTYVKDGKKITVLKGGGNGSHSQRTCDNNGVPYDDGKSANKNATTRVPRL